MKRRQTCEISTMNPKQRRRTCGPEKDEPQPVQPSSRGGPSEQSMRQPHLSHQAAPRACRLARLPIAQNSFPILLLFLHSPHPPSNGRWSPAADSDDGLRSSQPPFPRSPASPTPIRRPPLPSQGRRRPIPSIGRHRPRLRSLDSPQVTRIPFPK